MGRNLFVHQRLSKHGLIKLIVAKPSISNQIDDDIVLVFLAVLCRKFASLHDIIKRVSIYMEDWAIQSSCKIRWVNSRSWFGRVSCEPNLVVDDDVDCATDLVVRKSQHLHAFVNNSLTCERSISVDKNRHHSLSVRVFQDMLERSCFAEYSRVHSFEMRWVC